MNRINSNRLLIIVALAIAGPAVIYSCREAQPLADSDYNEWFSGGSQTVFTTSGNAFGSAFPILNPNLQLVHETGDGAFGATFVTAPAPIRPGLGPIFNNVSCTSCHIADGRGKPPEPGETSSSLLIRLSIPGADAHGGPLAVPGYGVQLQQRAIYSVLPEATMGLTYTEEGHQFDDGSPYSLRVPTYTLMNPYLPLPGDVMISPRIAPPVFGLGLLEAISDEDLLSHADPDDNDHDGISGKVNYVWDIASQKAVIGRFGWKANNPSVLQQSAGAYNQDMGITNYVFPQESSYGQSQYATQKVYDVSDSLLASVVFYIRSLAVPGRRDANNTEVLHGKKLFTEAKCVACHVPHFTTKTDVVFPEISSQTIFPYTDLLVHDMGPALADNRPDFSAGGQEWRTSPLWGIGLTTVVNGHNNFLHDGRARSLLEAIMWHGGEAQASADAVKAMSRADRDALIRFLNSL